MSEPQPELRWAPIPPAPRRRGRTWLIVILSVLAVAIAAALIYFFLLRDAAPSPSPSPSPSMSSTPTPPATQTPEPSPSPTSSPTSETSPPPVVDPDLTTFAAQVQPRLDDATTGLGFLPGMSGPDAVDIVDQLQQDADRLSDAVAPSSISSAWRSAVDDYADRLRTLRGKYENGSAAQNALDAAESALQKVRGVVGL